MVVEKISFFQDIERFRTDFFGCLKDTFRAYNSAVGQILSERSVLEKLETENLSETEKQSLCNQVDQLVGKLFEIYAESTRMIKR